MYASIAKDCLQFLVTSTRQITDAMDLTLYGTAQR